MNREFFNEFKHLVDNHKLSGVASLDGEYYYHVPYTGLFYDVKLVSGWQIHEKLKNKGFLPKSRYKFQEPSEPNEVSQSESQSDAITRPWGWYKVLYEGEGPFGKFKLKQIQVNPGESISYQWHRYRSEHWIVVSGSGRINKDGSQIDLCKGQSISIPVSSKHSLENVGTLPLQIIEIQFGESVDESDIVRLNDKYGRA